MACFWLTLSSCLSRTGTGSASTVTGLESIGRRFQSIFPLLSYEGPAPSPHRRRQRKEAGLIADACESSNHRSPETVACAREKDDISKRFNIGHGKLTAEHVLGVANAFPALRCRLLYNNATALGLFTHGRLEQLGTAYVLDRAGIAELHRQMHWD